MNKSRRNFLKKMPMLAITPAWVVGLPPGCQAEIDESIDKAREASKSNRRSPNPFDRFSRRRS